MDITPLTATASSTPEEAASNIQNANVFSINPTADKGINSQLAPAAQQAMKPTDAEPAVHDYMSQSTEHAAIATPDVSKLNYVDRAIKYLGDKINYEQTAGEKLANLGLKKMINRDQLSPEDTAELWDANQDRQSIASRNYDLSGPEKIPLDVGAGIANQGVSAVRGFMNNPDISNFLHPINSLSLRIGQAGFAVAKDMFSNIVGSTYNQMSEEHPTMDYESKRNISLGVGAVNAAVMAALPGVAGKMFPFLNTTMTPSVVAEAMQAPENAVLRMAVKNIGHSIATLGSMGAVQSATDIIKDEMGKNYDTDRAGFINSLVSASQKIVTNSEGYAERLAEGTAGGALTGGLFGLFGNVAGAGALREQVENIAAKGQDFLNNLDLISNKGAISGKGSELPPDLQPTVKDVGPNGPKGPATPWTPPNIGDEVPAEHVDQQAKDVLDFHEALHNVNDVMNSTKMNDLAPQESASFMKKVFDRAGLGNFYMTITGARDFAVDPEKAAAIKNIIDIASAHQNAPMAVDPAQVMDVARTYPEILDHVSPRPQDGSPLQAKAYIEQRQASEQKRQEILTQLGVTPDEVQPESNVTPIGKQPKPEPIDLASEAKRTGEILTELKNEDLPTTQKDKLNSELEDIKDRVATHFKTREPGSLIFGNWSEPAMPDTLGEVNGHLNAPTFPEALKQVLPKAEVEKIEGASRRAKEDRISDIEEAASLEMNKVHDINVEEAKEIRLQEELDRIAHDPNFEIVDKFRNTKKEGSKKSLYQIDPRTLTKDQEKFANHFRMKEHGVFAKDGMSADSAAQLLGAKDGNELLRILATTPTREQVASARASANAVADEMQVRSVDDLNHTKIIENIRDDAKNHLEWMKFMKDQEWPATKSAIKRIALPLPKIDELESRARAQVMKMKIGDLNANQWKVGEARSNRLAVNSILRGDIETAFQAKEQAAMNALIRKEILVRTSMINKFQKLVRKINKDSTQQLLKDTKTLDAMNELFSLWNFKPTRSTQLPEGIQESFLKWALKEAREGRGNVTIPVALSDMRQNFKDMTVEQFTVVSDRAKAILHEAKTQGKIVRQDRFNQQAEKLEAIEQVITEAKINLQNHPGRDVSRIKPPGGTRTDVQNIFLMFAKGEALLAARQNIIRELDVRKVGGFFHELLQRPDQKSFVMQRDLWKKVQSRIEKLNNTHGEIDKIENKFFDIPEFANVPELNYGKNFTKGDLAKAYCYLGVDYSRDLLVKNNGGVTADTWMQVIDRELTEKDVQYLHDSLGGSYKGLESLITERQKSRGRDVELVRGNAITHRGITRQGFYIPIDFEGSPSTLIARNADEFVDKLREAKDGLANGQDWGRRRASEATWQGYLIEREGSSRPLDLSFRKAFDGLYATIHDLAWGENLENEFTLWKRKDFFDEMVAAVGEPKVKTLIQNKLEIANRPSTAEDNIYSDANRFARQAYTKLERAYAIGTLMMKQSVVLKQFESTFEMLNALGPKGIIHAQSTARQMLFNITKSEGILAFGMRLDPNISKYFDGIQDNVRGITDELIPRKGSAPSDITKALSGVKGKADAVKALVSKAEAFSNVAGFLPVSMVDATLKTWQAMTVFQMIMEGDHPDIPASKLEGMTDAEKFDYVQGVVQQMSELTQIQNRSELQSPIQKVLALKPFVWFWNFQRNILNNTLLDLRYSKWKYEEAWNEGNTEEGRQAFATGTGVFLQRSIYGMIAAASLGWIVGKEFAAGKKTINNLEDLASAGIDFLEQTMISPFAQVFEHTPLTNNNMYALDNIRKGKIDVRMPEKQMWDAFAGCTGEISNLIGLSNFPLRKDYCLDAGSYFYSPVAMTKGYARAFKWLNAPSDPSKGVLSLKNIEDLVLQMKDYLANPPKESDPKFNEGIQKLHDQLTPTAQTKED